MSNPSYSPQAFKPVASRAKGGLLSELFAATPLSIFIQALLQQRKR